MYFHQLGDWQHEVSMFSFVYHLQRKDYYPKRGKLPKSFNPNQQIDAWTTEGKLRRVGYGVRFSLRPCCSARKVTVSQPSEMDLHYGAIIELVCMFFRDPCYVQGDKFFGPRWLKKYRQPSSFGVCLQFVRRLHKSIRVIRLMETISRLRSVL